MEIDEFLTEFATEISFCKSMKFDIVDISAREEQTRNKISAEG
jgi:hypothetical protein